MGETIILYNGLTSTDETVTINHQEKLYIQRDVVFSVYESVLKKTLPFYYSDFTLSFETIYKFIKGQSYDEPCYTKETNNTNARHYYLVANEGISFDYFVSDGNTVFEVSIQGGKSPVFIENVSGKEQDCYIRLTGVGNVQAIFVAEGSSTAYDTINMFNLKDFFVLPLEKDMKISVYFYFYVQEEGEANFEISNKGERVFCKNIYIK